MKFGELEILLFTLLLKNGIFRGSSQLALEGLICIPIPFKLWRSSIEVLFLHQPLLLTFSILYHTPSLLQWMKALRMDMLIGGFSLCWWLRICRSSNAEELELGPYIKPSHVFHACFNRILLRSDSLNVVNDFQRKDECINWINYAFAMDCLYLS